jgi:hypothetical protein
VGGCSEVEPIVASFSRGAVGVVTSLMVVELNNVKQQEHKHYKYCHLQQVRILTLTENMRLRANPLSKPYAEYLLRVSNGQKSSITDHFPPEADAEPSIGVEIALYPEIHQAPSLETLIHAVFPALAINYANQGYMDGRTILTTKNIVVNSLNTQIVEVMPGQEHIFLSTDLVETGDDQTMAIGTKFLNTITLADHWWRACGEYCQHTAHHHNNESFEVAIHPTKAPIPLAIGIRYDN